MFDSLPQTDAPVIVTYENLSSDSRLSDFQKDILNQMLREQMPQAEGIIDASLVSSSAGRKNDEKSGQSLQITCRKCSFPSDTTLYVKDSFRPVSKSDSSKNNEFKFTVANPGMKPIDWIVILDTQSERFFITLRNNLNAGALLTEKELEIKSCSSARTRCVDDSSFENLDAAMKKIKEFSSLQLLRQVSAGRPLSVRDVQAQIYVKTNDLVKVQYHGKSGLFVQTTGRAISSGTKGQSVRVEIRASPAELGHSGRMHQIETVIQGAGEVLVRE